MCVHVCEKIHYTLKEVPCVIKMGYCVQRTHLIVEFNMTVRMKKHHLKDNSKIIDHNIQKGNTSLNYTIPFHFYFGHNNKQIHGNFLCAEAQGACEYKDNKLRYIVNYYNPNLATLYSF